MKRSFLPLSALLFLVIFTVTRAGGHSVRFFDADYELSSSLVNNLFQDSYGLMWVATEEGLNCYDSNKFREFRHVTSDPRSLCSNYVNSLFETECGKLFVCTNRGIQIYNPLTRCFSERLCDFDRKEFTASVVRVINRGNGEYWVIGDSVRILNKPSDCREKTLRLELLPKSIGNLSHIHSGIADKEGNIWLSLSEKGLIRIGSGNQVTRFFGKPGDPSVSSMAIGKDGYLYLGTTNRGLLRYIPDNASFEIVSPSVGKEIKNLFADSNGDILQATDGKGIVVYSPSSGSSRPLRFGNRFIDSANAKTHCVVRDQCDNLWVGIFQSGVAMIGANSNSFSYLGNDTENFDVIGSNCISSIYKDAEGLLWVGADNDGIYVLNPDYSRRAHLINDDISVPMCLFEDSRKNIWVGTYLCGAGTIDRATGRFSRIKTPWDADVPANMCFAITEDRDHNVWLGMMHSGLIRYDLEKGEASIDFPWRKEVDPFIASLHYSGRTNSLYIGTYSGMQIVRNLSRSSAQVTRILNDYIVHSIDEDPSGTVWIGTSKGLVSYNPENGKVTLHGVEKGLPSTTVYAVRCEGGNVWMSLNSGMAKLDPRTGVFANFFVGDGLHGNEFYKNSVFKDSEGHIYFGGTGGITHFNPGEISNPGKVWTPRIVDIYSHGVPLQGNDVVYLANEFSLASDENTFSIEFGTSELGRPSSVRFAYSIDGKNWEVLPANTTTLNFYNLEPGHHTLSYKTVDGFTESPVKQLSLAVAFPWYSAPWTIAGYVVIGLLLLGWIIHVNRHRERSNAQLMELRHADQLNEQRIRSYINISHEIRTPMSLVISPLQKLINNDNEPSRQREYRLIMRNAKRVLRLIDELMDLRKIEKHQMALTFRPIPLKPFIDDICDTFAQAVADKRQSLRLICGDSEITADIDAANFDKILMNLVSNAVKNTPQGGEIRISLESDGQNAMIKVTDTGVGIPDPDKVRIFERFYQVQGNTTSGSGVGLHLTQQLVLLHGGEITVGDNPHGQGTCFSITIPLRQTEAEVVAQEVENLRPLEERQVIHRSRLIGMVIPESGDEASKGGASPAQTVLVVEDDEEIRRYIVSELAPYYKVKACSNGREALEAIFKNEPDLILSDIMMPEMDGLELTRTVKQNINLNHIPVVLLTALNRDEDNISAISAGADSYFTKPFNMEIVKGRIAALLQRYRELKNKYSGKQEFDEHIDEINVESADEKLIRRVVNHINKKINDPELTVESLASEVGLSRVHLHRKLKELTNQSPSDFIRNTRLRQAARLLKEKKLSVAEVAYATGFNSTSTFSTSFKKLFGVTPTAYAGDTSAE
ncbi:MAG: response regulator [Muribaculaceae bacterium]|nr:response regulator [Muribaculaceae bacterium]